MPVEDNTTGELFFVDKDKKEKFEFVDVADIADIIILTKEPQ